MIHGAGKSLAKQRPLVSVDVFKNANAALDEYFDISGYSTDGSGNSEVDTPPLASDSGPSSEDGSFEIGSLEVS